MFIDPTKGHRGDIQKLNIIGGNKFKKKNLPCIFNSQGNSKIIHIRGHAGYNSALLNDR